MAEQVKSPAASYTEQVHLLTLANMNGYNRLYGGQLMQWIDEVAGVVARRHSGKNVTTALVDRLQFRRPAFANDILVLAGKITFAGRTSMEIRVRTYTEQADGSRCLINEAYTVMVALDDTQHPAEVPGLLLGTEEERADWELARRRRDERKKTSEGKA